MRWPGRGKSALERSARSQTSVEDEQLLRAVQTAPVPQLQRQRSWTYEDVPSPHTGRSPAHAERFASPDHAELLAESRKGPTCQSGVVSPWRCMCVIISSQRQGACRKTWACQLEGGGCPSTAAPSPCPAPRSPGMASTTMLVSMMRPPNPDSNQCRYCTSFGRYVAETPPSPAARFVFFGCLQTFGRCFRGLPVDIGQIFPLGLRRSRRDSSGRRSSW